MYRSIILGLLAALGLASAADAQCVGQGGFPFNCATTQTPLGAADLFLGGSASGQNTIKFTGLQAATGLFALVPTFSGGNAATYLDGSGHWTIPAGSGGGGSGTVTSMSVAPANGLTGTVTNPTTTPIITLTVTASGLIKGVSGALVPATAGTDYLAPNGSAAALTGLPLATGVSGTLQAAQEPAHTGDMTNTAGSLATVVTKTNGVAFVASATTDTTNAANITSGALPPARLPVAAITSGSIAGASVAATTLSATGATTTTGITDSGGINTTATTGYRIGGITIFNVPSPSTTNAPILVGPGAGASLPGTASFDTFTGFNSGQFYAGTGAGEITGYGPGTCQNLSASATHDTCGGVYSMHYATTENATVSYGGDNMRNVSGTNNNTSNGSYGMSNFFGLLSVSSGANSLYGNAASILMGGTATNGDPETLTFTSTALPGGFVTVTRNAVTADTCAIRSAAFSTLINTNTALINADMRPVQDTNASPCVIAIASPNTSTVGVAPLVVTYTVGGSATETATITGGVNPASTRLVATGYDSMMGLQMTLVQRAVGYGAYTLANLTTGVDDACGGDSACQFGTTLNKASAWGSGAFKNATTAHQIAGLGDLVGQNCTNCRNILGLGSGVLSTTLTTANDIIAISDGSACDTNTPNLAMFCGSGGTFMQITGTNTSGTAIAMHSGSLQVGSTTAAALLNGDFDLVKTANSASGPGAGHLKLEVLAGTTGGTCKLIAFAGTSATPVTVLDNIGSGC
jgi:hypothetical protein